MAKFFLYVAAVAIITSQVSCQAKRVVFIHNVEKKSLEPHDITGLSEYWKNQDPPPMWVVEVSYSNEIQKNGWAVAEFTVNPDLDPAFLAYGAGFAEGYLTFDLIGQTWNNTLKGFCDTPKMSDSCKKVFNFLHENLNWMLSMIKKFPEDEYWKEVNKGLLQVQGLVDGYKNLGVYNPTIRLQPFGFYLFQLGGDLEDLEAALNVEEPFHKRVLGSGSCSALIKITQDKNGKKDLLAAQDTWNVYNSMLRIIKRFNFVSHSESFSGYPGAIFSGDDFNILSSGLVTMETTNGNSNPDLWKFVTPKSVPEWLRGVVANRLAKNAQEWCQIFSRYNSGTYNNQWMVLDYKKFENPTGSDLLYVLEQLPGEIVYKDVTEVLNTQTYWASYNVPYFPKIFNDSGQAAMAQKYGDWFTHDKNPRAKIFARDHEKVTDIDSMVKLMRYNDFKNDPLSRCNCTPPYSAENAIAARSDLNPSDGKYPFPALEQRDHGAIDVKVTSSTLRKNLGMVAECGPTHDQQPVFQWSTSPYAQKSHEGHPDKFDFKPKLFVWGKYLI